MEWFAWGKNRNSCLGVKNSQSNVDYPEKVTQLEGVVIQDMVGASYGSIFLDFEGNVHMKYETEKAPLKKFDVENVVMISGGENHFLLLTNKNQVYSWGRYNDNGRLGTGDTRVYKEPHHLSFFDDKNPICVYCQQYSAMVLCENNDLYGFGENGRGELGTEKKNYSQLDPILIMKNVKEVYTSRAAHCACELLMNGKYVIHGSNSNGQLGIGNRSDQFLPIESKFINKTPFRQLKLGYTFSLLLDSNNILYGTGEANKCGSTQALSNFQRFNFFENIAIKQIDIGYGFSMALTEENTIYAWGSVSNSFDQTGHYIKLPFEEQLQNKPITGIKCGFFYSGILKSSGVIETDFGNLLKSGQCSDLTISGIPVHSTFVQLRCGTKAEQVKKLLEENYNKDKIELVLKWVYTNQIVDLVLLQEIWLKFGITDGLNKTLRKDLVLLYNDEDSKDFNIIAKYEDDEEEEEEYEEIPIHKFVLCARSGLFRRMFKDITQESNSVKDFSGKSIESLEILFKWLYLNDIELTADDDIAMIQEEFEDIEEYYQLHENSNLKYKLNTYINKMK
ncbi:hypothetical protein M0813_27172 [Anaeramoeba flamelloides]|uniref:BTB domain-containing protein n=1 Tax=Anaeramoeba flamelloides TaxID=1746091 RepID=A0ABQ8XZ21_9EUKA|nr:hypothetical protein M0813_27172 [Anaeramoeba flamelloides]